MKEGWEIVNIGSICNIITGKLDANASSESGVYPFFTCSRESLKIDNYAYDCECVLIAGNGDLNVKYYKGKFNAYQRTYIVTLKNDIKDISVKYIFKFFEKYVEKLRQLSVGGVIKYIKLGDLTNAKIPVPPLSEQEKIVMELDCLSGIIEKKKQQLKELDSLAQSIFYEMFGDPVENEKGWEVKKLGEISDVTSFKRVLIEDVVESGIPFIRGTELSALSKLPNSKDYKFTLFITSEHYERVKAISGVPSVGDLLIPSINSDGLIWELDTDEPRYYKDGRVLWIHTNHNYSNSKALKYILGNKLRLMHNELASGATFVELKLFVLRDMLLPFPPLSLQQQFANKIELIEKQKELIKQSIKETETLFNSRMDFYFNS